jgi:hypothetical protein
MKTRIGFVSNSSSSSFIVASKEKPKMTIEINLENLSEKKIIAEKELVEYVLGEYGYKTLEAFLIDDKHHKIFYDKCIEALKEGKSLYVGSISNDSGNDIESYVYNNGWDGNKNFEILGD